MKNQPTSDSLPVSEALNSPPIAPDSKPSRPPRSSRKPAPSSVSTGPACPTSGMCPKSPPPALAGELFASQEVSPAKTYRWLESVRVWLEQGAASGISSAELLGILNRDSLSSKTCPVYYPATPDRTSMLSLKGWKSSGIAAHGERWTLSTSTWPNAASVCSLSEVLETEVARKYFLSPKACAGILRRAERRGKELPPHLKAALVAVAQQTSTPAAGLSRVN